jgi:hypothetical protein
MALMSTELNRRGFLAAAGLAGAAGMGAPKPGAAAETGAETIKLGVASYSLREYSRALAIRCIQELHTPYVSVKEFHLPYRSSPEELEAGRKEFERAGLIIMSGGNISLAKDDPDDIRRYFEYAKMCGMPMMVCAPTHTNLGTIEKMVKEYNIRIAIHTHGPEDKQYPTPQSVLAVHGRGTLIASGRQRGGVDRGGRRPAVRYAHQGPAQLRRARHSVRRGRGHHAH